MKILFALLLLGQSGDQWNKIACGIVNMAGVVVKSPHKLNVGKPRTIKIYGFSGGGPFQVGIVPKMPQSREEALDLLQHSDCSASSFVTSVDDLTCELSTGEHYFILVSPKEDRDGAYKIAYEIYSPPGN